MTVEYCSWTLLLIFGVSSGQELAACDSPIYCDGPLLHTVQLAKLFEDGKEFVDMSLKQSPELVLAAFKNLTNHTKESLEYFVSQYFSGPGEELELWTPPDFVKLPMFLNNIKDPSYKDFGWDMCRIWKDLGRQIKEEVKHFPDKYSMIYLPKPFIVPGGRFRETFYWDSYWVIKGLLVCEMNNTVKGMLENFIHYVKTYGFIPNGGRIYFTRRSQPPFLMLMMDEYYKATNDFEFIRQHLPVMESEYEFWQINRSVTVEKNGITYELNQYRSNVGKPRPESYWKDTTTAEKIAKADRPLLYANIASACESGWDFSCRWFSRDDGEPLTLDTISTMDIIPVDLNSILCQNERILMKFYQLIGNANKVAYYQRKQEARQRAIEEILFNKDEGMWLDYSLKQNKSRDYFYMSNIFPVYMECANLTEEKNNSILEYIQRYNVTGYKGGIPTSIDNTGQQWDFPNAWSPLQQVMIWSMDSIPQTQNIAFEVASAWLDSNHVGWERTRGMFEKYNVLEPGTRGGGGEYNVQEGFGWTNGVVLDILKKYGDRLTSRNFKNSKDNCVNASSLLKSNILIIVCTIFLYMFGNK